MLLKTVERTTLDSGISIAIYLAPLAIRQSSGVVYYVATESEADFLDAYGSNAIPATSLSEAQNIMQDCWAYEFIQARAAADSALHMIEGIRA